MEESLGLGLMAVCAVSGRMVLLVHHIHNHLFSDFMNNLSSKWAVSCATNIIPPFFLFRRVSEHRHHQKKPRFREVELAKTKNNDHRRVIKRGKRKATEVMKRMVEVKDGVQKWRSGPRLEDMMPPNRAVLYRGIMKYRTGMGKFGF